MAKVSVGTIKLNDKVEDDIISVLEKHGIFDEIEEDIKRKETEGRSAEEELLDRIFGEDEDEGDEEFDELDEIHTTFGSLIIALAEKGFDVTLRLVSDEEALPIICADIYRNE